MRSRLFAAVAAPAVPEAALAGPPFLTDDPEPTETRRWGVFAPLLADHPHSAQIKPFSSQFGDVCFRRHTTISCRSATGQQRAFRRGRRLCALVMAVHGLPRRA